MNICSMCAATVHDNVPYIFTVADIPVIVGDNMVALINKPFSPLLRMDTIVIGSDNGYYVGDIVEDQSGGLWGVSYSAGFSLRNLKTKDERYFYDFDTLKLVTRLDEELLAGYVRGKTRTKFKYQGYIFTLLEIVGRYKDDLIALNVPQRVVIDDIQQDLQVSLDKERVYLGDKYRGLYVIMCYGRICVQNEFGVYDIYEGKYIVKERS